MATLDQDIEMAEHSVKVMEEALKEDTTNSEERKFKKHLKVRKDYLSDLYKLKEKED